MARERVRAARDRGRGVRAGWHDREPVGAGRGTRGREGPADRRRQRAAHPGGRSCAASRRTPPTSRPRRSWTSTCCWSRQADDGVLRADGVREALVEHGDEICAVVATGGSTNFGIVDDIKGIAGAQGRVRLLAAHRRRLTALTAMLAPEARHIFEGVERADSVIVDPHKWLFAPFDCWRSDLPRSRQRRRAHTQHAEYLDILTEVDEFSPSDYSIQLTRRPRGLPMWFSVAT